MVLGADVVNDFSHVTIMFALPRSRTQWWSRILAHGVTAWHDPLRDHASPHSFLKRVREHQGRLFIADTAAVFFHDAIVSGLPGVQRLYMIRNPVDVIASLRKQTGQDMTINVQQEHAKLFKHAFNDGRRIYWGCIDNQVFGDTWEYVTGATRPDGVTTRLWCDTIIDTPIADQPVGDIHKLRSLMGYREP